MKKHWKKLFPIFLLLIILLISLPFLTSCSSEIPGVNGEEIVNLIFPQPIVMVAQVIATIILLFLVLKLVWKPYNELLEKRKQYVLSEINEVDQKKKEIFDQENELKEKYLKAQIEVSEMIENAKNKSENIILDSKEQAKINADKTLAEAREEISKMKLKMKKEVESQNIDIILSAASELAMKNINSDDNKKFVEDFLSKLDKEL